MNTDAARLTGLATAGRRAVVSGLWPRDAGMSGDIVRTGVVLGTAGVVVQSLAHLLGVALGRDVGQLNLDLEATIWSWLSTTVTGAAAFVLVALAVVWPTRRRLVGVLAALVAYMSADDALQIHERLKVQSLGLAESARVVFPAVYAPLFAATFLLLWWLASRSPVVACLPVRIGLAMLVLAVGCELVSAGMVQVGLDEQTFAYDLEVIVEEGLELLGWVLIATGLTAALIETAEQPR